MTTLTAKPAGASAAQSAAARDATELAACFDGDRALMAELIGLFLAETPDRLADLRHAVQASDAAGVERAAHTLRGSLDVFGALGGFTAAAAKALESMGQSGDLTAAATCFALLAEEVHRLEDRLARAFAQPRS